MKRIPALGIIILTVGVTIGVIGNTYSQKITSPVSDEEAVKPVIQTKAVAIKTNINQYQNAKIGFAVALPETWMGMVQNEYDGSIANILFYDKKYDSDIKGENNPLLALIIKKDPYISLSVNNSGFIKKADFDIKSWVSSQIGGPQGGQLDTKLLSWEERVTTAGQKFYVYTNVIQSDGEAKRYGAIWISNGKLFELQADNESERGAIEEIAKSFRTQ